MTDDQRLRMQVLHRDGLARAGVLTTPRGTVTTPCFMPVGTRGAVRHLSAEDLQGLGAQIVLGNTYHLMLKPGPEVIGRFGGLHGFTGWDGHVLTDSGGYQVFSLDHRGNVRLDDDGVTFRSTYDGGTHRLTPEIAVDLQTTFGSDLQMVLDVCTELPATTAQLQLAVDRTAAWAVRARSHFLAQDRPELTQLGIVQGGVDPGLRVQSAERTVAVDFDGYAVGGLSVGEHRDDLLSALAATVPVLPEDRPRYLMGVGDPVGMLEAIALGIDLFDCVLPTRFARHGTILSAAGRYNLKRAENATDDGPLDAGCPCPVCARWSRAYLRHLMVVDEPTAPRLITLHNLHWTFRLVAEARSAIAAGTFAALRSRVAATYG